MIRAAFDETGARVLTYGIKARIWDATSGAALTPGFEHGFMVSAGFTQGGDRVWSASLNGDVVFWDAATGLALTSPRRHATDELVAATFDLEERWIATLSTDGVALVREHRSGQPLTSPLAPPGTALESLAFDVTRRERLRTDLPLVGTCLLTEDRRRLIVPTGEGALLVWPLDPSTEDLETLERRAHLASGRVLDPTGMLRTIEASDWQELWRLQRATRGR
jgi:WD40 repeat protein